MEKTISASELQDQVKRVLNEIGAGSSWYVVEQSGEPIAALVNMDDFRLLQTVKQPKQAEAATETASSFLDKLASIHRALYASGYRPRTSEEINAQLEAERDSWGI